MTKLKLKKKVLYRGIIFLVIVIAGSIIGLNFYNDYKYKQTYEYKLIEHGYTLEEAKSLLAYYKENETIEYLLSKEKNSYILELIKEKYYIHNNLERYLAYAEKNKETTVKDVVAIVNVNRDYKFYEHDIDSDIEKDNLVMVNKYYTLPDNYEPANLTDISLRYSYAGNKITKEANDAYVSMWNAANNAGFTLIVNSSFRDHAYQERVYNNIKASSGTTEADKVAARPGHSEHQSGLAIDVFEIGNQTTATFKDSPAYTWLKENAHLYGFIERYPEDKEYLTGYSFESWHWRYVGLEAAKIIHDEEITFDEYYAYYIENQA